MILKTVVSFYCKPVTSNVDVFMCDEGFDDIFELIKYFKSEHKLNEIEPHHKSMDIYKYVEEHS